MVDAVDKLLRRYPQSPVIKDLLGTLDADAIQRQEEWANESAAERRLAHEGVMGRQADDFAARTVREGTVGEAEHFAEGDR